MSLSCSMQYAFPAIAGKKAFFSLSCVKHNCRLSLWGEEEGEIEIPNDYWCIAVSDHDQECHFSKHSMRID